MSSERFNPTDLSVAAQVARIKATAPQGVFTCASGTVFGTVVHGLHDGGLDVPTAASSSNMNAVQLQGYAGLLPRELYFAGPRGVVEDTSLRPGPVKDAQTAYFGAFRAAKVRPGNESALVWDQTMIVIDALRHAGATPTAAKLRDYIEGLHDRAGIAASTTSATTVSAASGRTRCKRIAGMLGTARSSSPAVRPGD